MKTKLFSALLFSALLIAGCDKVKFPREGTTQNGGGGPEVYTRKVLVEDYTGHYCGTCPPAAVAAKNIQDQYGEQVVVVSVHAEFLAGLFPPIYTYDFRTTEGNDYDIFFGLQATPTGMVNRRNYPTSNHFLSYSTWAGNVASILPNPVETKIEIENTYNTGNRQLTSTIKSKMLTAHSGLYKLVVWITEDSIIKPQKDNSQNPSDILNYVHRHVLRGSMNSTWGDTAFVGNIVVNDSTSHTYTLTLNSGWNENRCHVVAYIYDDDPLSATYKEVLQVEEKHVVH